MSLISLWSQIKSFVLSKVSIEVTPNVGLVLSRSEDPNETYP